MSNESSDIDILYVGPKSVCPGRPTLTFLRQQVHLLENLQKNYKHLPTDYKDFLNCVNALEIIYEPAVILGAWKVLLDKHLLHICEEAENRTTSENVKQNITDKLMLSTVFEKIVPNQTIDSINSNNNSVSLKKGKKNSNPGKRIATANKIENIIVNEDYINYYTHGSKLKKKLNSNNNSVSLTKGKKNSNPEKRIATANKIENEDNINYYTNGSKLKKKPTKNSGSIKDTKGKELIICKKKSKDGQTIEIPISRDETSNNSINAPSKPELSSFFIDGNSSIKEKIKKDEKRNSVKSKYQSINLISCSKDMKNNSEDQSNINIDNDAKGKETGFDSIRLFRNTKLKVKKDELNITQKPVSCTKIKIKAENDITHEIKKKTTGSKRKKKESFENADISECSSSSGRKKRHRSNFSLEDFSATILGNFIGEKKSINKIRNMDESELKKYGLTKSELIQFCKEQKKERAAEKKKLETQMLEMFHDRLVDVIIPKYYSFDNSN